ncbi:Alpha/Beta hydrolase protein [Dactylonectria estremocensis]|uniref:Alpha/Beta hydrolase protein n=1 Tax=Dactylonectria estremocensis TaxID=1079267 RepID=A0A9P9ERG1_9HYPO|nr:Alpha/Beta hydrolase protein [Dactylonectria estremocensis]
MSLEYDAAYLDALKAILPKLSKRVPLASVEDIQPSRIGREADLVKLYATWPDSPDIETAVHHVEASDGYQISVHSFTKRDVSSSKPGSAIVHYHGGGMILGSAEVFAKALSQLVSWSSVPIFSVNYRLAPEHNGTTPVEDCYTALSWLYQNAAKHNVNPSRIAVFGESAGGGLAAGVALMARDRNLQPPLAKQILVYPMLDDRNLIPNEAVEPLAFWKTRDNVIAWTALLGDKAGDPDADVSPYTAPTRAKSLADVAPAYIDVGTLDIFRDESIAYATRLMAHNIATELHVYPGLPHAFQLIAPEIPATRRAMSNRLSAILSF